MSPLPAWSIILLGFMGWQGWVFLLVVYFAPRRVPYQTWVFACILLFEIVPLAILLRLALQASIMEP